MNEEERKERTRPVLVRDYYDVYHLTETTQVECPDCEMVSPEMEDVFALVKWVDAHEKECTA